MKHFRCPICKDVNQCSERYPYSVCNDCVSDYGTLTKDGTYISFSNQDCSSGCVARINGQFVSDRICYIRGVKCMASAARFGGIVFNVVQ